MKKTITAILKYLLLLGIGIGLLLLAFKGVDVKKTFAEMKEANLFWLGMSVLASLVAFVSRAYRWNMLIEPLGYKPALKNTTAALMIGYLANLAVPRLGEVSRCGSLAGVEKVPFEKLLGTVIVERIIDVITLILIIVLTIIVQFKLVKDFFMTNLVLPAEGKMEGMLRNPLLMAAGIAGVILIIGLVVYLRRL